MAYSGPKPGDPQFGLPPNFVPPMVQVEDVNDNDNNDVIPNNGDNGGINGGNGVANPPLGMGVDPRLPFVNAQQPTPQVG